MVFKSLVSLLTHTHVKIRYNFPALHVEIYRLPPPLNYEFALCPPHLFQLPPIPTPDNYSTVPKLSCCCPFNLSEWLWWVPLCSLVLFTQHCLVRLHKKTKKITEDFEKKSCPLVLLSWGPTLAVEIGHNLLFYMLNTRKHKTQWHNALRQLW